MVFFVCVISGQGACLIVLSAIQSMLNFHTIVCSQVICTLLIGYFIGSDSLLSAINLSFGMEDNFNTFMFCFAIVGIAINFTTAYLITDDEDGTGLMGKGDSLSKGLLNKRLSTFPLIWFTVYVLVALGALYDSDLTHKGWAIAMIVMIALNIILPLAVLKWLTQDKLKAMVSSPS